MKKSVLLAILLIMSHLTVFAQQYLVTGKVIDAQTTQPIEIATAALLRPDSTVISGVMTDEKGAFQLKAKSAGSYILKVSFIGYLTIYRNLALLSSKPTLDMGNVSLEHNDNVLGTATITATAAKVEQVEDTTMFNAAAYRVPEGSTLEALVKQLPGIEIEDDGTITWNGKKIKEFLVNGKDFFKGQADVALKNLPSDWISRIKAYEKQSEYTEQTGIEDGEEYPVLDIVTKRELNETWITNTDLAYGTEDRYAGRVFVSRFTEKSRVSVYGSMNNVSDKSFGGKRRWGGGGLSTRKNAGMDFNWRNGKKKREAGKLELGGNLHYNHNNTTSISTTNSESFFSGGAKASYRSSLNRNNNSGSNFNASFRLDWNPDSMTNINFRPSYNYSNGDNNGNSLTATFNEDPFSIDNMVSPLDSIWMDHPDSLLESMTVNRNIRTSMGDRVNNSFNGSLNIVRRLNSKGSNVSLGLSGGYTNSENNSYSISNIFYYNDRPNKYQNQYSHSPSVRWNYTVRAGFSQPIIDHLFAQVFYAYSSKYNDNDRSRYLLNRIDSLDGEWYDPTEYPSIGTLPDDDVLIGVRDSFNSQYATYNYYDHRISLNLRYNTKDIRATAGVNFNPEKTKMEYERPGQHIDTMITRHVFKLSPELNFRYNFNKRNSFEMRYRGSSSQPSMTDLLAVVDNSHALNISMGNPGLKPGWTNTLDMGYRGYQVERQQGIAAGLNFTQVKNAVSRLQVYDQSTGVHYHRPENINGNWNTRANFMFNTGLGEKRKFTIATNTNLVYNNAVGYVSSFSSGTGQEPDNENANVDYDYYDKIFDSAEIQKNTTRTLGVRERLNLGYRNEWLHVGTVGTLNYNHSRSNMKKRNDRDTWNFTYGLNGDLNFKWGFSMSTDIRMSSRRGYPNKNMNTDELLWNAQIAYSFLKKKAATISLQFYDILQEQSNVSHSISATSRSDSWNNAINSYCMVHFIYKFRYIGGKKNSNSTSKGKGHKKRGKKNNKDSQELNIPQNDFDDDGLILE